MYLYSLTQYYLHAIILRLWEQQPYQAEKSIKNEQIRGSGKKNNPILGLIYQKKTDLGVGLLFHY